MPDLLLLKHEGALKAVYLRLVIVLVCLYKVGLREMTVEKVNVLEHASTLLPMVMGNVRRQK